MSQNACTSHCGFCGLCDAPDDAVIRRTCTSCGYDVWVHRGEDYCVQVFCRRCQRDAELHR
jgi:hypothetical protein